MSSYDYIIVGAGSAGCVLAARLSEDQDVSVLVIEAGPPDQKENIHVPAAFGSLFKTDVDWDYATFPEAGCNNRMMYMPRGKTLGGSSSINAMVYIRGNREVNSRQYTSWFNFRGSDQQKPVGQLSGGERNRVHLAKLLRSGGNVLLLDEPTNDLDVDTLRALEEALLDFAGCAVVITHDRWFLDRVATHILAFEGNSEVTWFEGTWAEYAEWVKETRGADALEPHRIKYKPLVRA